MQISILRANQGDSIHIRFPDRNGRMANILVDGGPSTTFEFKQKGHTQPGPLKKLIQSIRDRGEKLDLVVLTHVDSDHIGGLLRWFAKDLEAYKIIAEVWFNSGRLISEYFEVSETEDRTLRLSRSTSIFTSIAEGVVFEDYLTEKGIWNRKIVKQVANPIEFFGGSLTILSPDETGLSKLQEKWSVEVPDPLTGGRMNDYGASLTDHIQNDRFSEDMAVPNQSSIAFILTVDGKNFVFLADAHPTPIINALRELGYSKDNKLVAELVKLSHHGSKGNTNDELLALIDCKSFIISSNGAIHSLPDKQCLARILNKIPDCRLYFNYAQKIDEIFSVKDRVDFPEFTTEPTPSVFEF